MGNVVIFNLGGTLEWETDTAQKDDEEESDYVDRVIQEIHLEAWGEAVGIDDWTVVDEHPPVMTLNQQEHTLVVTALEFYVNNEEIEESNEDAAEEARKLLSIMGSKRL